MAGWVKRVFGGHRGGEERGASRPMAIDPVCNMQVDEERAAATSQYMGKTFYFCAPGCKKAFDEDPEKYLTEGTEEERPEHRES